MAFIQPKPIIRINEMAHGKVVKAASFLVLSLNGTEWVALFRFNDKETYVPVTTFDNAFDAGCYGASGVAFGVYIP